MVNFKLNVYLKITKMKAHTVLPRISNSDDEMDDDLNDFNDTDEGMHFETQASKHMLNTLQPVEKFTYKSGNQTVDSSGHKSLSKRASLHYGTSSPNKDTAEHSKDTRFPDGVMSTQLTLA